MIEDRRMNWQQKILWETGWWLPGPAKLRHWLMRRATSRGHSTKAAAR
jgi:hypothetical protein